MRPRVDPFLTKNCRDDGLRCGWGAGAAKRGAERLTPMKTSVAYALLTAPVLILLAAASPASAASPAYCALYAREYAGSRVGAPVTTDDASALQRVEDQAYYRCLNQDEAPQFPATSAYFGAPLEDITGAGTGAGGPFQALQIDPKGKTAAPAGATTASQSQDVSDGAAKTTEVAGILTPPAPLARKGGHASPGSPEWVSWCKSHYRSFDAATGYVLTFSGDKKVCPG